MYSRFHAMECTCTKTRSWFILSFKAAGGLTTPAGGNILLTWQHQLG